MKRCGVRFKEREAGRVAYFDVLGARRIAPPTAFWLVEYDEPGPALASEIGRQTEIGPPQAEHFTWPP